jgi:hypothetical protein
VVAGRKSPMNNRKLMRKISVNRLSSPRKSTETDQLDEETFSIIIQGTPQQNATPKEEKLNLHTFD